MWWTVPLLLLGIPACAFSSSSSSSLCPLQKVSHELLCFNRSLVSVPPLSAKFHLVDLSYNNIGYLHKESLTGAANLDTLYLDHNKLYRITDHAFFGMGKLRVLSMRDNHLVVKMNGLSSITFRGLERLEELYLSNNPLEVIASGLFRALKSLKILEIDHAVSGLKIEPGSFEGLFNLTRLSLRGNQLLTLASGLKNDFQSLVHLNTLLLDDNSWHCDCHLEWLARWFLSKNHSTVGFTYTSKLSAATLNRVPPVCHQPDSLQGQPLFQVPLTRFECQPVVFTTSQTLRVSENSNVTLSCYIYMEPRTFVQWFKGGLEINENMYGNKFALSPSKGSIHFWSNLTIFQVHSEADTGWYRCEARNSRGTAMANFSISVVTSGNSVDGISSPIVRREWVSWTSEKMLVVTSVTAVGIVLFLGGLSLFMCFLLRWSFKPRGEELGVRTLQMVNGSASASGTYPICPEEHMDFLTERKSLLFHSTGDSDPNTPAGTKFTAELPLFSLPQDQLLEKATLLQYRGGADSLESSQPLSFLYNTQQYQPPVSYVHQNISNGDLNPFITSTSEFPTSSQLPSSTFLTSPTLTQRQATSPVLLDNNRRANKGTLQWTQNQPLTMAPASIRFPSM